MKTLLINSFFVFLACTQIFANTSRFIANSNITKTDSFSLYFEQSLDENPEFPGGISKLMDFISQNLQYPKYARERLIEGKVIISFVVEKDGSISNVKVEQGIGGGCDEEAVRIVSMMPKWKPGKINGKPVRVSYNLPITFKLTDESDGSTSLYNNTELNQEYLSNGSISTNLNGYVNNIKKKLPLAFGLNRVTSIDCISNVVVVNILLDESLVAPGMLEEFDNLSKWSALTIKQMTYLGFSDLFNEMISEQYDLKMVFTGNENGKTLKHTCSHNKLNELIKNINVKDNDEYIKSSVAQNNMILPTLIESKTYFAKIFFSADTICYSYETHNNPQDIDMDYLRDITYLNYRYPNDNYVFLSNVAKSKYKIKHIYSDFDTDKLIGSFYFTPQEIDYALKHRLSEYDYIGYLDVMISHCNKKLLPSIIEEGLTLNKLTIESNYLVYDYTVDDNVMYMDFFKDNNDFKTNLLVSDLQSQLGELALECNKGFLYRFTGIYSKKQYTLKWEYEEIISLLEE